MRKACSLAAVSLLFVSFGQAHSLPKPVSAAAPQATPAAVQPEPQMQTFTSAEGRFSVQIPGAPKLDTESVKLQGNDSSTLYEFWVEMDNGMVSYMVMYNDYPANYANDAPQSVLARTRDGAVKGKTLTSDVAIELNGVPGRAFTANDDKWNFTVHQFLAGKRLYQLIVVVGKDHAAPLTDQFMNSFRIQ